MSWAQAIRSKLSPDQVESQASRIEDPVERLRFLRQAAVVERAESKPNPVKRIRPGKKHIAMIAAVGAVGLAMLAGSAPDAKSNLRMQSPVRLAADIAPDRGATPVWLVETKGGRELYSNGLQIESGAAVPNEPRLGYAWTVPDWTRVDITKPQGIVYHTTESLMAPFDPSANDRLRHVSRWTLDYVRRRTSYHFLVDRFGIVHRVVREDHSADHAGHSIWAGGKQVFVRLNHTFLGVAVEWQTQVNGVGVPVSPAQVYALKTLTAMLRSKYRIPAANCVTHAQVSVNPDKWRIGAHTDWAASFPYAEVGLPDNYRRAVPSMYIFGFNYDDTFVQSTGSRVWTGLALTEEQIRQDAAAQGLEAQRYRALLRNRYREIISQLPKHREVRGEETESTDDASGSRSRSQAAGG